MFKPVTAFSGFSVDDVDKAVAFYHDILGLEVSTGMGGAKIALPGGGQVWAYPKPGHQPASYTMLNLVVADIDAAVKELQGQGVTFARYEGFNQDEQGIARGKASGNGPDIAWFTDPAGNIIAVLQD
jgi:catechol 2,3-dioxygenase-like lactoylglutathione lyase family enzyme